MEKIQALIQEVMCDVSEKYQYYPDHIEQQRVVTKLYSLISMVQEECAKVCDEQPTRIAQYCSDAVRELDFSH